MQIQITCGVLARFDSKVSGKMHRHRKNSGVKIRLQTTMHKESYWVSYNYFLFLKCHFSNKYAFHTRNYEAFFRNVIVISLFIVFMHKTFRAIFVN